MAAVTLAPAGGGGERQYLSQPLGGDHRGAAVIISALKIHFNSSRIRRESSVFRGELVDNTNTHTPSLHPHPPRRAAWMLVSVVRGLLVLRGLLVSPLRRW